MRIILGWIGDASGMEWPEKWRGQSQTSLWCGGGIPTERDRFLYCSLNTEGFQTVQGAIKMHCEDSEYERSLFFSSQ